MPFDGTELSENLEITIGLIKGRERLEAGWCRNATSTRKWVWPGRYVEAVCMLGAGGDPRMLLLAMADLGYAGNGSIHLFNDAPQTRKEDVLAIYDRAIAISLGDLA